MNAATTTPKARRPDAGGAAAGPATAAPDVPSGIGPAEGAYPWGLYVHVIVVSFIGGFLVLGWFVLYEGLNKLIWENGFVTGHAWMFPVICLPFSLVVGLLVKYAKAPSNLDGSMLDSLTGDVLHLKWKDLPQTIATSLASLFSGAVLGPEGAIGNLAGKIAALYCDLPRIPADRRPKLVFASVSSGYNGLLENPNFAAVLGTEVAETKQQGLSTLPASLIGGAIGHGIFKVLHKVGFPGFRSGFLGGRRSRSSSPLPPWRWRSTWPFPASRWRSSWPASWPGPSTCCSAPR